MEIHASEGLKCAYAASRRHIGFDQYSFVAVVTSAIYDAFMQGGGRLIARDVHRARVSCACHVWDAPVRIVCV